MNIAHSFFSAYLKFVVLMVLPAILGIGAAAAEPTAGITNYLVEGVFLEARLSGRVAVIAHDPIPAYMDAMTMPFNVKNPADLRVLRPGDRIRFRLSVSAGNDWIEQIKPIGKDVIRRSPKLDADSGPELKIGAIVPDFVLTNQAGREIHLAQLKGQAVALTFFFGRCPLPTYCPRMNANFAAVQQALQSEPARTNWQLLSISFDPAFDTPEFLGSLGSAQKSDPRHWSFVTSSPEEIRRICAAFGLTFRRENGSFSHNLRSAVIDTSGRLQKVFTGNEWLPGEMVAELKKAMRRNN